MSTLKAHKINLLDFSRSDTPVPFRNTLLAALYPDAEVAILQASTDPDDRRRMEAALAQRYDGLELDFATGAKKRGEFIATDVQAARRFWQTPEQAMAYGSNLLTTCLEPPQRIPLRVLVAEDGAAGTGDCHAKLDVSFAYTRLGCDDRAAQFRLAAGPYLAKGTMATYSPYARSMKADMIIPLSAFKSAQKPALGMHYWHDAILGITAWSQIHQVKVSWQVLQWFSKRTIEHDVLPYVRDRIARLLQAGRSTQATVKLLRLDKTVAETTLINILTADVEERLATHPWVVRGLTQMLRRRWLHLALGGGLHVTGLMGLPDDSLPTGVISTPELPHGPMISFRYPVRSWSDLRLWHNAHKPQHRQHQGVVWMSHETASLVAGDFDGDIYNFIIAGRLPAATAEIRHWHKARQAPPVDLVKTRRASSWDKLPQVAMHNVDNMVGLITYFIAQACAMRRLDLTDALALELQVAVDKFKYDLEHDQEKIEEISEELKSTAWLQDRRSRPAFYSRPLEVDEDATDTISYLARQVSSAWESPSLRAAPIQEFIPFFPPPTVHVTAALELNKRYGRLVADAIQSGDKDSFTPILQTVHDWARTRQDPEAWATAIWHAVHHNTRNGVGSLAFHAFPDQVVAQLAA
jgi:hypothetical protein